MNDATERTNGNIFFVACLLVYLSAPVRYVGVVQAALCDKLDASAVMSNLPATGYFFACFAPIVCAGFIPHRLEKATVVACCWGIALLSVIAAAVLFVPMDNGIRVWVIVSQSLLLGLLNAVEQVFLLQCLGRGTTTPGRARAFKLTYTIGPIAAVVGSSGGQWIIRGGLPFLTFPQDFAVLYLFGGFCSAVTALACTRLSLTPIPEEKKEKFWIFLRSAFGGFFTSKDRRLLWLAYLLWYTVLLGVPNLSLYTREAMGREPSDFSGAIMAIQFAAKACAGFAFGLLFQKCGEKAPVIGTVIAAALGMIWALSVPGYAYLLAFVAMGAAQLGGIYFPNVLLSWSPPSRSTQDLAVLNIATVFASPAPALYGLATDHWGFPASFAIGIAAAGGALVFVLLISPRRARAAASLAGGTHQLLTEPKTS